MDSTLETKIKEIIDKHCYLTYDEESKIYTDEIYADYRDKIDDKSIKEIFQNEHPRDKFYDLMSDWYMEAEWDCQDEVLKTIKKYMEDDEIEFDGDEIADWIRDNVNFAYPYDHYLNQEICVDLVVDTGDGNYDFVLNGVCDETIDEKAPILWLARQQGYTKTALNKALQNSDYGESKFLKSMDQEIANCSSHMNALAFFVKMTLGECLELNEHLNELNKKAGNQYEPYKRKYRDYLVLDKGTSCGLCDFWSGAGSVLEIELEQDVKMPLKYIDSVWPDGMRGYSVAEIYGMCSLFWDREIKNIHYYN